MELTINKECLMRILTVALTTEKRILTKEKNKYNAGVIFESKMQRILGFALKKTIKDFNIQAEEFSGTILNLEGVFRWFSKYNFKQLKTVQDVKLLINDVEHRNYDKELVLSFDKFKTTTLCKSAEYQAKKEEEARQLAIQEKYGALLRYKEQLSNPPVQYNKMNDFVVYNDILDIVNRRGMFSYSWKVNDINKVIQENRNKWIKNAEHRLVEYKNLMQKFFSDDLHKELVDDAFIAEIKDIEERLTKESEDYTKTVNECFNRLKNEVEAIFSSEASRLEFSMRLFYSFYSNWIYTNRRLMLNDFKSDVSTINKMINSFDVNLFTNEQIFDIWNKMQELLKVKKKKTDVYTNEQRLEKTKELMALDIEYKKHSKYGLGYNLLSLIEKSDVEIDNKIAWANESIERKKQEKLAEEEFELKASVIVCMDLETKEPKQYKVAVGMLAGIAFVKTSYMYFNYVIIDIDTEENKIQVMNEEQSQLWLDCKTIHDIEKYPLANSFYRSIRDKMLGDLQSSLIERAESKGLYVIQ